MCAVVVLSLLRTLHRAVLHLVTADNVGKEGEELDLDSHKVHVSLLVKVRTGSARKGKGTYPQLVLGPSHCWVNQCQYHISYRDMSERCDVQLPKYCVHMG